MTEKREKKSGGKREGAGCKPGKWRRDTESRGLTLTNALWNIIESEAARKRMRRSKFLEMILDANIERDDLWGDMETGSIPLAKIPLFMMGQSGLRIIALTAGLWKELDDLADTKFRKMMDGSLLGIGETPMFRPKTNECIEYILLYEISRPENERTVKFPRVEKELFLSSKTWERLRSIAREEKMWSNHLIEKLLKVSCLAYPSLSPSLFDTGETNCQNGDKNKQSQKIRLPAWVWRRAMKEVNKIENVNPDVLVHDYIETLLIKGLEEIKQFSIS